MDNDAKYMKRALELAAKARGMTSPNPMVGAVLVNNKGEIVGEGYHKKAGEAHAEINALNDAGELARGSTLYVTLEPCSHYGKTPPCSDAIVKAGIKRVVIACGDPNVLVNGKGIEILKKAGVEVKEHVLEEDAKKLNEVFFKWVVNKRPFVVAKYAMTIDGKIATFNGDSKWITNEKARKYSHYLRSVYDAILVGKNTIIKDNPSLTCRYVEGKNPIRIILDSRLEIPLDSNVITDNAAKTILVVNSKSKIDNEKLLKIEQFKNVSLLEIPCKNGKIDLNILFEKIGEKNITSVFVEGGSEVHGALFDAELVDRLYAFIAMKIVGGCDSLTPVGGSGVNYIKEGCFLTETNSKSFDDNIMITGLVEKR